MSLEEAQQHQTMMLRAALDKLGSEIGARCPHCGKVARLAEIGYPTMDRPA